ASQNIARQIKLITAANIGHSTAAQGMLTNLEEIRAVTLQNVAEGSGAASGGAKPAQPEASKRGRGTLSGKKDAQRANVARANGSKRA
ncbi:MAG TPA: methyl-accepting chemotaxis protein, partial [Opitutus sp.]|nr:methyl-accepting chemotaxis protein [Opitutus sp.]